MKLINSKNKQEIKRLTPHVLLGAAIGFFIGMIGQKTWGPLVGFGVVGAGILVERIMKSFKREVRGFGIIIFMIFFITLFLFSQRWKPWETSILLGLAGVYLLIFTLLLYKRTRMIYATMGNGFLIIAFFIQAVERLIIHEGGFWSLIFLPAIIFMIITQQVEKKKNPEKMKEWEKVSEKASFWDILLFKSIPKIR